MTILNAKTVFSQVLFKIAPNPTIKLKTDSGIIINSSMHQSQETGGFEKADEMIGFGFITAVGPDCKYVKVGDAIVYYRGSIRPVPIGEEIWQVSEQNIMAFVDKDDPTLIEAVEAHRKDQLQYELESKSNIFVAPANFGGGDFSLTR